MKPQQVGFLLAICVLVLLLSLISPSVHAQVTGPCANCHTMHNSQGGNPIAREGTDVGWLSGELHGGASATNAAPALLVSSCLGCHSSHTSETIVEIGESRIPIVYNIPGPVKPLAGGNFFWVKTDDAKGHNVFFDNPDEDLSSGAPGTFSPEFYELECGSPNTCHINFDQEYDGDEPGLVGRQGCTGCHMVDDNIAPKGFHHADDDDSPVIDDFPWYRFLKGHATVNNSGVKGIEDLDWQATNGPSDHNEYLGKYQAGKLSLQANTMTAFCGGCHKMFHFQESDGAWIRHPSDTEIPTSGEYASAFGASDGMGGVYNPDIPVARSSGHSVWSSGISGSTVDPAQGNDMVMCLSCHVAHGSPYPDMLRWNYDDMEVGGGGSGGCFACHTEKN